MSFAMCFDTSVLVGLLFIVLITGVAAVTPFVFALVAFVRWADARQRKSAQRFYLGLNDG